MAAPQDKARAPAPQPKRPLAAPHGRDPRQGYLENVDTLDARRFVIAIKRLADTLSHGTDHSRFLGSGIEYVQSRPYVAGDSVRAIDWRVTARTGKYHVKDFEAPKRVPVWILLDTSASMTVTSTHRSKYAIALHVAGGLALASLEQVRPVGVLGVGDRDVRIQPTLSRDRVLEWVLKLRAFRYDEDTSLARKVVELNATLKNRAQIIVLSDLHDPQGVQALKLLGQVHDVVALQLQDPAELDLRGAGFVRAQEAETGAPALVRGRQKLLDPSIVQRELRKGGIDHLVLKTNEPFVQTLRQFLEARGLAARAAR